jgi:spore coat protein A, manganese oxidase
MAGFYMIRDELDTGKPDNPLKLPAYPYELPLAIQDRMFKENGELFYPAFRGDPFYSDFITDQDASLDPDAPTALAEFFGDHMVVNGKIWPKTNVEPRKYRLRLLNGCDSRFLVIQFVVQNEPKPPLDFHIIGGDQGLASSVRVKNKVVLQPSGRLDIIVDFSAHSGKQILLTNEGGDEPFGGHIPGPQVFDHTDKIMLFNVSLHLDVSVPDDYDFATTTTNPVLGPATRVRRLGLFEGTDQYGRLQPLLGTVDPATDRNHNPIIYPSTPQYTSAGLQSTQMVGTMTWHAPTTENMNLNDIEDWEIWNLSDDAHPIHL